jgi:tRNA A37 threonylcarbamoyladenosine biosynthesis protein TsaE
VDIEEILADSQAVTMIEWAERAGNYHFSAETWNVQIEGDGDDPRTITVEKVN